MDTSNITTKKGLKDFINMNGSFNQMQINEATAPNGMKVPEGAKFFRGIASNGDLNRNGYIIEETAFKDSVKTFMENPVILLQHNADKPIGKATSAKVTEKGLEVEGFIFQNQMDEISWNSFENGVLRGLSTGHITKHAKFKNNETNLVVDEEEVGTKGNPSWSDIVFSNAWTMIVTALDWVEFSLVTIPANQKSMITETNATDAEKRNAIEKYAVNSGKITDEELSAKNIEVSEETTNQITINEAIKEIAEEEAEKEAENAEGEEATENVEPASAEEVTDEVEETAENAEESEPTEEEASDKSEVIENDLKSMTTALAKNLLKVEEEVKASKNAIKENEVESMIDVKLNAFIAKNEIMLNEIKEQFTKLSNSVVETNKRLDGIAINKPMIIHSQLEKAKEAKKTSWA